MRRLTISPLAWLRPLTRPLEIQEPASIPAGKKLPVMFEIHGGGFLGEYRDDDGTNLIHSGLVIYVYAEYRLGILGSWPTRRSAPTTTPETQPLGAYHSAINRLVHDSPASLDVNQRALQSQVLSEWTGFAGTGQPTASYTPLWPPYTTRNQLVMSLQPGGDSAHPDQHDHDAAQLRFLGCGQPDRALGAARRAHRCGVQR